MSKMFLDPARPLSTCTAHDCEGCPASQSVQCHFQGRDLVAFLFTCLPAFVIGGAGVVRISAWWLLPWVFLMGAYFGFIEIRVMCSHCPHYAEPGGSLQCWANYGSPRLWKYRPGPMTTAEKVVFIAGLVAIMGYPMGFLLRGPQWLLLFLYLLTATSFFVILQRSFCSHCMNFACPFNEVDARHRAAFFERNPTVAQAWEREKDARSAA
jgi:hypothetical protein